MPDELPWATDVLQRAAAAGRPAGGSSTPACVRWASRRRRGVRRGGRSTPCASTEATRTSPPGWPPGSTPWRPGCSPRCTTAMPSKRYHSGRGWTDRQLDAGLDRLRAAGIIDGDPPALTEDGAALRESIEVATDRQQRPIIEAIGDDFERLVDDARTVGRRDRRRWRLPLGDHPAAARVGPAVRPGDVMRSLVHHRGVTHVGGQGAPTSETHRDIGSLAALAHARARRAGPRVCHR